MQKSPGIGPKQLVVGVLSVASGLILHAGEARVVNLETDGSGTPLAVDRPDPMLSWMLEGDRRGMARRAYRIQAAGRSAGPGELERFGSMAAKLCSQQARSSCCQDPIRRDGIGFTESGRMKRQTRWTRFPEAQ